MNKKLDYIDVTKGFAIMLVVFGHICSATDPVSRWIYSFHMPVFFMITGILMGCNGGWRERSVRENTKKEAKRLLKPYYIYCLIAYLYILYLYFSGSDRVNFNRVITTPLDVLIFEGSSALWFLPALFFAKFLFVFLHKKNLLKPWLVLFTAALVTALGAALNGYIVVDTGQLIQVYLVKVLNVINHSLNGFVFLSAGYGICGFIEGAYSKMALYKKLFLVILFCAINFVVSGKNVSVDVHMSVFGNPLMFWCGAFSGSVGIILFMKTIIRKSKILEFFGRNSLTVMATHKVLPVLSYAILIYNKSGLEFSFKYGKPLTIFGIVMLCETAIIYLLIIAKNIRKNTGKI